MARHDADKWDAIYRAGEHAQNSQAARVLRDYTHLLPASGSALDLACGRGRNALLLAAHGLQTAAWDVSAEAIQQLQATADATGLTIATRVCDVVAEPPAKASFDVIVVSYFLERALFPQLLAALRPRGLLFYQTFIRDRVSDAGPRNANYRLARNELLELCKALTIRVYHEEGLCGDNTQGFRNEALLIGEKAG